MPYILIGTPAYKKYAQDLTHLGYAPIELVPDKRLNPTVASHADTLIWSNGKKHIANADYLHTLPGELVALFQKTSDFPHGDYPSDTVFNALVVGRYLFARKKSISAAVQCAAKQSGLEVINVNQGYARCSTLALPEKNAAITADNGMARSMKQHGIEVLQIAHGHIALDGCEYGFIGGASFVDQERGLVCFFGDITKHPDADAITSFIERHGYSYTSLDGELTDFGGAVIIK